MKCTIIAENFKKALSLVERSTGRDLTLPILSSFLLRTENGKLNIMGTNLEVGIETSIRSTIHEPGKIAIPAKTLASFVTTIPKDEKIILESKGQDVTLDAQNQSTLLKGFASEDFPLFPPFEATLKISFAKRDLERGLRRALSAVSKNTIKPELASVLLKLQGSKCAIAATDSFRLSEEQVGVVNVPAKSSVSSILIPSRTVEEILKMIEYGEGEEVELQVGTGELLVISGEARLYSRLTEGNFPDYQPIIPRKFTTSVQVDRAEFASHIRRASIFTNKLNGISCSFVGGENECIIESSNRDVGEYKAAMKCEIDGEGLSIVFNYHYLLDGVEGFSTDKLFLGLNSESHPLLLKPNGKEESFYIVMPMKNV